MRVQRISAEGSRMTEAPVATNDISHLVELLERQVALFDHLGGLAERQSTLVNDGQAEALLALLAQRQQLIDQLDVVTAELEPFRSQWSELWTNLEPSGQKRISPLVERCQQQLSQIMRSRPREIASLRPPELRRSQAK